MRLLLEWLRRRRQLRLGEKMARDVHDETALEYWNLTSQTRHDFPKYVPLYSQEAHERSS